MKITQYENKNMGVVESLSNADYHADSAIGSSGLIEFAECPALYWNKYLNPEAQRTHDDKYRLGSYAHIALLEPHIFEREYLVSPEFAVVNKGKKNEAYKTMNKTHADWNVFEEHANSVSKKAILHSEYIQALAMADAIKEHELANAMMSGTGKNEMSFFALDECTGLRIKARPDRLVNVKGIGIVLVDYKTTALSLSTSKQSHHAFGLSRHIQAAHHKEVVELVTGGKIAQVCYITQMQEAPYLVRVFRMPEEALAAGSNQIRSYLGQIADCHARNQWSGYPSEIEDFILPNWINHQFN